MESVEQRRGKIAVLLKSELKCKAWCVKTKSWMCKTEAKAMEACFCYGM